MPVIHELPRKPWRVSRSGYAIVTGTGDERRVVAQIPPDTNTLSIRDWMNVCDPIVEAHNDAMQDLHERLEDCYYFDVHGDRIECEWGGVPDGISCRDATIQGQDELLRDAEAKLRDCYAIATFIAKHDQELYWRDMEDGKPPTPVFNCNDFFAWGSADAEAFTAADLPDIERAMADVDALSSGRGHIWGPLLWIARKRGMRPQGAFYAVSAYEGGNSASGIPAVLTALFNACGPHRPASPGNPYPTPDSPA